MSDLQTLVCSECGSVVKNMHKYRKTCSPECLMKRKAKLGKKWRDANPGYASKGMTAKAEWEPPPKVYTTRSCIKCDSDFKSEGNWNRVCDRCNSVNTRTYCKSALSHVNTRNTTGKHEANGGGVYTLL